MTVQMNLADQLKAVAFRLPGKGSEARTNFVKSLQRFEATMWIPAAFSQALATLPGQPFVVKDNALLVPPNMETELQVLLFTDLLDIYVRLVNPPIMDEIYDMKEAAAYLGIGDETFKTYVQREKRLNGTKKGNSLVFTREQLDAFNRTRTHAGRPKTKVDSF